MDRSHRLAQAYKKVIDVRTGHETSNVQAVLDGDLDGFLLFSYSHAMT